MFETLFGSEMPLAARFFIAFLVVLALIGLTAWLVRRFGANRLGGANTRGRQPRLAVVDAASVDGRRRLLLIRRDNVEHLLMIGGPTDVVVEQNIVRAAAAREVAREPVRAEAPPRAEPAPRATPQVENAWPLQPEPPQPAPRPYRAAPTEEPWLAPEPGARPRPADSSSLTGLAAELSSRLTPPETSAPPPRSEPMPRSEPPARAVAPPPPPAMTAEPEPAHEADHNLADMAQQLEAALRRAPVAEGRPPVTDPLAAQVAPQAPAEAPPRAPARDYKLRVDPKFETRHEPKFDARPEPSFELPPEPHFESRPPEPKREPKPQPAAVAGKTVYDSLEEEMASLLGRPPGKT